MIKSIKLTKNKFGMIRRSVAGYAFFSTVLCLLLLLFGFIPFLSRSMNIIAAVNNIFEFVYFGKKPFLQCISCIAFAIIYIISIVKISIAVVSGIKGIKDWLISNVDDKRSRRATQRNIDYANSSLWWLFFLYIASYLLYRFSLTGISLLVVIGMIVLNILMNATKDILFKGEVENSIINAINRGIILFAMIMFAFFSSNIQIVELFHSIGSFFSAAKVQMGAGAGTFMFQMLLQQIVIPIFDLIMLFSIINLNVKINNGEFEGKYSVQGMLIRNIVFLCIILIGFGYISRYVTVTDYMGLLCNRNIIFLLMTALIYVTAYNTVKLPADIGFLSKDEDSDTNCKSRDKRKNKKVR